MSSTALPQGQVKQWHVIVFVIVAGLLILGGSLAATRAAGWQALACITGIAFLYLGSVAILLPGYAGSWGTTGGILGILGGLGYLVSTLVEARKNLANGRGIG